MILPIIRAVRCAVALGCMATATAYAADRGSPRSAIPSGARYVAMGSSFASGPGIRKVVVGSPPRCGRSDGNYAHLLARRLDLELTDVSCGGATTAHILGAWNELPAQIDALTDDTQLVTITIGGNDVGYVTQLGSATCRALPVPPSFAPGGKCVTENKRSEENWRMLDRSLRRIAAEVRRRAPAARLVFVDYLSILPARASCAAAPMSAADADDGRATARRLSSATRRAARAAGADYLNASALSKDHGACSADPWVTGFPLAGQPFFVPYHPNARGMSAVADALAKRLGWGGQS